MRHLLISMFLLNAFALATAQQTRDRGERRDPGLSVHLAPSETRSLLHTLINASDFVRAKSTLKIALQSYPWDPSLYSLGVDLYFLSEDYGNLATCLKLPENFHRAYPEWAPLLEPSNWKTDAICYVAHLNKVKTGRDPEAMEAEVLKQAWEQRASLPFGMIDEEGVHVDKQVLTLILLMEVVFREHYQLLFERAEKLAPNDTFILELKAKRLIIDAEEAQAVEMYKKALKAKASKERIKHLKTALAEAEKLAEWRKVIGPRKDKKAGGGSARP